MVDVLSRRYTLLASLDAKLLGFEYIKELYENNSDFDSVYHTYENVTLKNSIGIMVTCLKRNDFVFLSILCVSCLFVKYVRVV